MSILSVIFLILKYIAIVLGILLVILISALLMILFIPFYYSVYISASSTIDADVKVSWLIKLIYYRYIMNKSKTESNFFRVFTKKIINKERKSKRAKKPNKARDSIDKKLLDRKEESIKDEVKATKENESKIKVEAKKEDVKDFLKEDDKLINDDNDESFESRKEVYKRNYLDEELNWEDETDEIDEIGDDNFSIKSIINYPNKKEIIKYTYQFAKRILRHIKPRKFSSDIEFGLEDPSHTGYILAGIGIIKPCLGNSVHIKANFNEKVLNGELKAEGRFQVGIIIIYIASYLLKKPIKEIVKNYLSSRKDDNNGIELEE